MTPPKQSINGVFNDMTINPNDLANTAQLTFADDFNSLSLWNGQTGTWNTGDSWGNAKGFSLGGNGEQEWYINSQYAPTQSVTPWTVSDGALNLTAQPTSDATKQEIGNYAYTSGQVNTFHSFSQTYGYFEMRAELPAGQGLWPAFWLLPEDNSWPPEIDVMENLGNNTNMYATTVHTADTGTHTQTGAGVSTPDLSTGFHTYGVDWEADKITWYFDGKQVFQADTPADMNKPAYMIANLAVGGYWPGNPDPSTPFPATMKIDYIHAYSAKPDGAVDTGAAPTAPVDAPQTAPADQTHATLAATAPVSDPVTATDVTHSDATTSISGTQVDTENTPPLTASSITLPSVESSIASTSSDQQTTSAPTTPLAGSAPLQSSVSTDATSHWRAAPNADKFDFGGIATRESDGQGHANANHPFERLDWTPDDGSHGSSLRIPTQSSSSPDLSALRDHGADAGHAQDFVDTSWHQSHHGHHFF